MIFFIVMNKGVCWQEKVRHNQFSMFKNNLAPVLQSVCVHWSQTDWDMSQSTVFVLFVLYLPYNECWRMSQQNFCLLSNLPLKD